MTTVKHEWLFAKADEGEQETNITPPTLEEVLKASGYSDEQIALVLKIPNTTLYTKEQVDKLRSDLKNQYINGRKQNSQPPTETQTTPPAEKIIIEPQPQPQVDIQAAIAQALAAEREAFAKTLEQQNKVFEERIQTLATTVQQREAQELEKHRQALLAQLPQTAQAMLYGNTIEELNTSFANVKAFIDTTVKETAAAQTAAQVKDTNPVFFKAADGTEYDSAAKLVLNPAHLAEWKLSQK